MEGAEKMAGEGEAKVGGRRQSGPKTNLFLHVAFFA